MYVDNWFGWSNGIYAIVEKSQFSEDSGHTEFSVRKARLEGNQVILENADLPELDLTSLVRGEDDNEYVQKIMNLFVADDKLVIVQGEEWIETIEAISLRDGYCTEIEPDDCGEVVPGPEGTLLRTKAEWNGSDNTATVQISSIDMDGRNDPAR